MRKGEIAVLLPCYNEAQTIGKVVSDMKRALPYATVYVYDNNSTDDTAMIARDAGAVVRKCPVQGKGAVVRQMFQEIDADVYLMADGDDTYPAEDARALVNAVLEKGADMAVGDRLSTTYFTENKRPFHSFGNRLVRLALSILFKSETRDVLTGYRAFSFRFAKTFPVLSSGFQVEAEMTAHAADRKLHIIDVPIAFRDRPAGSESKLNTVSDGIRVLLAIAAMFRHYKPLVFFGSCSVVLCAVSAGCFIPVLLEYFDTGLVDRFPTLIVCGFLAMAGLLSLACGLVLASLRDKDKRDFEFRLHEAELWRRILLDNK